MRVAAVRLAKAAWVAAVVSGVAVYGWYRARTVYARPVVKSSLEVFRGASRGGQLLGAGRDTIVLFCDYRCPHCAQLYTALDSALSHNPEWLTVRVRHFVPAAPEARSFQIALAAECAAKQGLFEEFSEWTYRNVGGADEFAPSEAAYAIGVASVAEFESCVASPATGSLVIEDIKTASELGVPGTPTIFTRRYKIVGALPVARLKAFASVR
ncbi:MAG: hypothetical protein KatS3mg081_0337 [Gemmatimonadales bacterium]|nr:MAG: hypothetical protein KatS3mg081_0337 [Gemmatimonadales bacterium]